MVWDGWFALGGNEFANAARTEAYMESTSWFRPTYNAPQMGLLLNDGTYRSPLLDDAPWLDAYRPESADFFGFYPLEVTGLEDSTRTSTVTESTTDGGNAGRIRHATRSVVFNGLLLAASDAGAQFGADWLRQTLLGSLCGPKPNSPCAGDDLCFFAYEPTVDLSGGESTIEECLSPIRRHLRKFAITRGPIITGKRETTDGGAVWMVTFTGTAGDPWQFGDEVPVIVGFGDPNIDEPWVDGSTGVADSIGYIYSEVDCEVPRFDPLNDPLAPVMIPPPAPPSVPRGPVVLPTNWRRRQVSLPAAEVPLWSDAAPVIDIRTANRDVRTLRLRFYADPYGLQQPSEDPCGFCGDMLVQYIPSNSLMRIDAASRTVMVEQPGGVQRRADAMVFGSDNKPFDWPMLTCGTNYVVTVDLPQTERMPVIDLSLVSRAAA
jgi:hypothetical protein